MSLRKSGHEWFTRRIPCSTPSQQSESLEIWYQFLTFQLIFSIPQNGKTTAIAYQPNVVARQFGLGQVFSCPGFHFMKNPLGVINCSLNDLEELYKELRRHAPSLTFFEFSRSHLATVAFDYWGPGYF